PQVFAVLAAVLFGASTPASKRLLGDLDPIVLAGLLYLGAGVGAATLIATRRMLGLGSNASPGGKLSFKERFVLSGAVIAGGLAAPIAMMLGLRATPAGTASLLLNFEAVATALLAAAVFGESVDRRVWLGIALVTLAGFALVWTSAGAWGGSV